MSRVSFFAVLPTIWVLYGCGGQPEAALGDQMVKVDGHYYVIPKEMRASDHMATDREIAFFKRSGVPGCKKDDIVWEAPNTHDAIAQAIRNGDNTIHKRLAAAGRIGCASPVK